MVSQDDHRSIFQKIEIRIVTPTRKFLQQLKRVIWCRELIDKDVFTTPKDNVRIVKRNLELEVKPRDRSPANHAAGNIQPHKLTVDSPPDSNLAYSVCPVVFGSDQP